jgi:hypothetical protein
MTKALLGGRWETGNEKRKKDGRTTGMQLMRYIEIINIIT